MTVVPSPLQVTSLELKFLLLLLAFPDFRAPIALIRPQAKLSNAARDRLCQQLAQKGLVEYEALITRFGLTARGRTLLNLDTSVLPVTPDEKTVLRSCQDHSITPGQIHPRVPENQRQTLISQLAQQQLVRVTQRHLGEVWLTTAGQRFLREECAPQGDAPAISLTLMSHYLNFLRQSIIPAAPTTTEA